MAVTVLCDILFGAPVLCERKGWVREGDMPLLMQNMEAIVTQFCIFSPFGFVVGSMSLNHETTDHQFPIYGYFQSDLMKMYSTRLHALTFTVPLAG